MKKEFFIAGVQFRPKEEIGRALREIKVGDTLELVPEPENQYDPNAVKITGIFYLGTEDEETEIFLGYVPKKFSSEIAMMIELGQEITCTISELNPTAKPWEKIKVAIFDEEEVKDDIYNSCIGKEEDEDCGCERCLGEED